MVRVTKVGHNSDVSPINVGEWYEGIMDEPPMVGDVFFIWNVRSHKSRHFGYLHTSRVVEITQGADAVILKTLNSVYRVENIQGNC